MEFRERLYQLRKGRGISQEELAHTVGVSRQAVQKWEAGTSRPDLDNLAALARYFNVTLDYLVTGQVDEAWLRETSATDLATSLRVNYVLANRQGRLLRESLSSSQSRTGLPSGAAAENLMLETLRDLVKPMAQKIVQTIQAKK